MRRLVKINTIQVNHLFGKKDEEETSSDFSSDYSLSNDEPASEKKII